MTFAATQYLIDAGILKVNICAYFTPYEGKVSSGIGRGFWVVSWVVGWEPRTVEYQRVARHRSVAVGQSAANVYLCYCYYHPRPFHQSPLPNPP